MPQRRKENNKQAAAGPNKSSETAGRTSKDRRLDKTILILGAPGLVGSQVTRQVARDLSPDKMVLASLNSADFGTLLEDLREEYPKIEFVEVTGNIFVRTELTSLSRAELQASHEYRDKLYDDLFGPLGEATSNSTLVQLISTHEPDVIIDCINTATGISYQDVDTSCKDIRKRLNQIRATIESSGQVPLGQYDELEKAIKMLLVSQSVPQIVRHIQLLHNATERHATRIYIKIGTTGTGGMGLNIPYTHGEDKPSARLMAKSSIGFAHTGLMFLMARTPNGPIVKEIKPGAMIGYKKVVYQELRGRRKYIPQTIALSGEIQSELDPQGFEDIGAIKMVGVDTGENGFFARGEFEAVSVINQMEFVTPEEIAHSVVLEIKGSNTGHDVIAAIDGAVMPPSYRAGYLRVSAIESLLKEQERHDQHSVATGELGPPKLTKLLYEAHLLYQIAKHQNPADTPRLSEIIKLNPKEISRRMESYLQFNDDLRNTIISIGMPILLPDGKTLLRGPSIKVPENPNEKSLPVTDGKIKDWAEQGWVDLRPDNVVVWQKRFGKMLESAQTIHLQGSAAITKEAYRSEEIRIGEVVGWIFNNEVEGYRIK